MRYQSNKSDIHGLLTNLHKANKYFLYHKELSNHCYKKTSDKYPIISDARQAFYFRAVLHLCHFLNKKEDLYVGKIVNAATNERIKEEIANKIQYLETDSHIKLLFNLRDKWIGHRDNKWYLSPQNFPDETFEFYLKTIKEILELALDIKIPVTYMKDLIQSAELLDRIKEFE